MIRYTPRDYVHFARIAWRNRQRQRAWATEYEASIRDGTFCVPHAAVVQLIPTEACNLRCAMCNQWGDNGYFKLGVRKVQHMDRDDLTALMRSLSARDSLISVHGGEPFAYKHIDHLLELLAEQPFDVLFSTNGTLLDKHLDALARLPNLGFLLSIDGDETTHDAIRGPGRFRQAADAMARLFEMRRSRGMPLPVVIMSYTVCELNGDTTTRAYEVARSLNAFVINYNMRWFLTEEVGVAYERHLQSHFGIASSGAWRGWLSERSDHDYTETTNQLARLVRSKRFKLFPPYVVTTPAKLRGRDFRAYFADYLEVFGRDSCFMPFYWARVHANGDLIFCPGHPDIIAGNVFRDGFVAAFNSSVAVDFRKHILHNRFPICNRCCGLYMTKPGRPFEQRARKRLGLTGGITTHWP
jgi:MoaA/NifB/PqqE/SkfB family radical SAM enzyme